MTYFYDGVKIEEIELLVKKSLIKGVTTNLSFVNESKRINIKNRDEIIEPIFDFCKKENLSLSIQLESNELGSMIDEGESLFERYQSLKEFYLKVPISMPNLEVVSYFHKRNVKINATCITNAGQAISAMHSGASIVSFFWGKMSDQGIDPYKQINIFDSYRKKHQKNELKILAGSIRQPASVIAAIESGADIVTTSYQNLEKITNQLLSDNANQIFQDSNMK